MNEEILKHLNNHEFQEAIHLLDSELKKNSLNYDGYWFGLISIKLDILNNHFLLVLELNVMKN